METVRRMLSSSTSATTGTAASSSSAVSSTPSNASPTAMTARQKSPSSSTSTTPNPGDMRREIVAINNVVTAFSGYWASPSSSVDEKTSASKIVNDVVGKIRRLAEIVALADQSQMTRRRRDDDEGFLEFSPFSPILEYFYEKNVVGRIAQMYSHPKTPLRVKIQILQTLSILLQSLQSEESLFHVMSQNNLNRIINARGWLSSGISSQNNEDDDEDDDESRDEHFGLFLALLKTIALRLDEKTVHFFYDESQGSFPLFDAVVELTTHTQFDSMRRSAVRTVLLMILRVKYAPLNQYLLERRVEAFKQIAQALVERRRVLETSWRMHFASSRAAEGVVVSDGDEKRKREREFAQSRQRLEMMLREQQDDFFFLQDCLGAVASEDGTATFDMDGIMGEVVMREILIPSVEMMSSSSSSSGISSLSAYMLNALTLSHAFFALRRPALLDRLGYSLSPDWWCEGEAAQREDGEQQYERMACVCCLVYAITNNPCLSREAIPHLATRSQRAFLELTREVNDDDDVGENEEEEGKNNGHKHEEYPEALVGYLLNRMISWLERNQTAANHSPPPALFRLIGKVLVRLAFAEEHEDSCLTPSHLALLLEAHRLCGARLHAHNVEDWRLVMGIEREWSSLRRPLKVDHLVFAPWDVRDESPGGGMSPLTSSMMMDSAPVAIYLFVVVTLMVVALGKRNDERFGGLDLGREEQSPLPQPYAAGFPTSSTASTVDLTSAEFLHVTAAIPPSPQPLLLVIVPDALRLVSVNSTEAGSSTAVSSPRRGLLVASLPWASVEVGEDLNPAASPESLHLCVRSRSGAPPLFSLTPPLSFVPKELNGFYVGLTAAAAAASPSGGGGKIPAPPPGDDKLSFLTLKFENEAKAAYARELISGIAKRALEERAGKIKRLMGVSSSASS